MSYDDAQTRHRPVAAVCAGVTRRGSEHPRGGTMTTETVTDYETQEVQREIKVCDRDGCDHRADGGEMVEIAVNPRYRVQAELDIVNDEVRRNETVDAEAAVSLDLCERCFTTLFTDVNSGAMSDVTVDSGGITVTEQVEHNVVITMPWDVWEVTVSDVWAVVSAVIGSALSAIVLIL